MSEKQDSLRIKMVALLYGELPSDEIETVKAEIEADPELSAELERWQILTETIKENSEQFDPSPTVRETVLAAAREAVAAPRRAEESVPHRFPTWMNWLEKLGAAPAFAGFGLVVLAAGLLYTVTQEYVDVPMRASEQRLTDSIRVEKGSPESEASDDMPGIGEKVEKQALSAEEKSKFLEAAEKEIAPIVGQLNSEGFDSKINEFSGESGSDLLDDLSAEAVIGGMRSKGEGTGGGGLSHRGSPTGFGGVDRMQGRKGSGSIVGFKGKQKQRVAGKSKSRKRKNTSGRSVLKKTAERPGSAHRAESPPGRSKPTMAMEPQSGAVPKGDSPSPSPPAAVPYILNERPVDGVEDSADEHQRMELVAGASPPEEESRVADAPLPAPEASSSRARAGHVAGGRVRARRATPQNDEARLPPRPGTASESISGRVGRQQSTKAPLLYWEAVQFAASCRQPEARNRTAKLKASVRHCVGSEMTPGTAQVSWEYGEGGRVRELKFSSESLKESELEACLRQAFAARWPAEQLGPACSVRATLKLKRR